MAAARFSGQYFRKPKPPIEARIATVECLQVTVDVRSVRVTERRFDEASADAPPWAEGVTPIGVEES